MATTMEEHAIAAGKAFPWHELNVPDVEAGLEFYKKAFGMGTEEFTLEGMPPYRMLTVDGKGVAGSMSTKEMSGTVPPHWSVYMAVDDVDKRLAKAKELGATVVVEPMDVPTVGRMALLADPQGAHFWIFKSAS